MSHADIQDFLQNLDRSRLLGADGAAELWQIAGAESAAAAAAEGFAGWLVQQGKLTRYQADKLLRGHTRFFLDDYKLMDRIGSGRMAGVYRAIHKLGMPVAVKILPPSTAKQPEVLARFQREAELALQLDHPHVVKTYHAGANDGLHYIAMEFLEGETLEDRLKEKGKLPPDEVLHLADQALQALGHLLEMGMVHRDVKPGNLMLVSLPGGATAEKLYAVKLLDVGLGRVLFDEDDDLAAGQDLTAAGALIGTPDYTAPEQSRDSHAADIRSDLYGLGCTLYESLTGRVPFPGKNVFDKIVQHAKEMPPPLDLGSYPRAAQVQAWLWKLLAKSPADRFQTPGEAAAALQPLLRAKVSVPQAGPIAGRSATSVASPAPAPARREKPKAAKPSVPALPSPSRRSSGKYVVIGLGVLVVLAVPSYFLVDALSGSRQKTPQGPDKPVASNMPDVEEIRHPPAKETPKAVDIAAKKADPEPTVQAKKIEAEPTLPAKKMETEPTIPTKKVEPELIVSPREIEPEPKVSAKKEELKKEPAIAMEPAAPAEGRLAVPSADEIAKAAGLVKSLYKVEYAKTKTADRLALAATLLEEAAGTKDEAARYVLLRDARNLAARAGNATLAMLAAEELANTFQVGPGQARAAVADQIVAASTTPASAAAATEPLIAAADAARSADDWPSAVVLAKAAEMVSQKAKSIVLVTLALNKVKEVETMKAEADRVKDHIATLKTSPDDSAANLAVGRFYCLIKRDWEAGIAYLAKGNDTKLRQAAEMDMKAAEGSGPEKLTAADGWYDLARTADPAAKLAIHLRAHAWYSTARPELTGLERAKAEKRLAELQALVEARADRLKLWMSNHKAIADGQIKKCEPPSASAVKNYKDFEEFPKDGAILIGFYYDIKRTDGKVPPDALQPIYLAPRGEIKGKVYGLPASTEPAQMTKAKPGYAVGAIFTGHHGPNSPGFGFFKPIYMKITDKGLDPNNRYEGPLIGCKVGHEGIVGGDGNFIVGVHGKVGDNGGLRALSVVTLTTQEPKTMLTMPDPKKKDPKK